jgi:hypothetical protein
MTTTETGIDHIKLGHNGEINSIDPETGLYFDPPVWYCYTCDRAVDL